MINKFSLEEFGSLVEGNHENWILRGGSKEFEVFDSISHMKGVHPEPKQIEKDVIYLEMASIWGKNSKCNRLKVGCLITKNKSIISDGYNGTPMGFPNICEDPENNTFPCVLHAEANAITKLAKSSQSSDNACLYVTYSPCFDCSKLIIQSGIRRVVFSELYRKTESLDLLRRSGIEIVRIKI